MVHCSKLGQIRFGCLSLGPIFFGMLWSAPEHSPSPAPAWITKVPPKIDDQAALGQAGKRPPRGSVLGLVDRSARAELVGVSRSLQRVDAAALLNGGE